MRKLIRDPLTELPTGHQIAGMQMPLIADELVDNEWFVRLLCAISAAFAMRVIGEKTLPKNPDLPKTLKAQFNGPFWETQIISVSGQDWPDRLKSARTESDFKREVEACFSRYFEYAFSSQELLSRVRSEHRPSIYSPRRSNGQLPKW